MNIISMRSQFVFVLISWLLIGNVSANDENAHFDNYIAANRPAVESRAKQIYADYSAANDDEKTDRLRAAAALFLSEEDQKLKAVPSALRPIRANYLGGTVNLESATDFLYDWNMLAEAYRPQALSTEEDNAEIERYQARAACLRTGSQALKMTKNWSVRTYDEKLPAVAAAAFTTLDYIKPKQRLARDDRSSRIKDMAVSLLEHGYALGAQTGDSFGQLIKNKELYTRWSQDTEVRTILQYETGQLIQKHVIPKLDDVLAEMTGGSAVAALFTKDSWTSWLVEQGFGTRYWYDLLVPVVLLYAYYGVWMPDLEYYLLYNMLTSAVMMAAFKVAQYFIPHECKHDVRDIGLVVGVASHGIALANKGYNVEFVGDEGEQLIRFALAAKDRQDGKPNYGKFMHSLGIQENIQTLLMKLFAGTSYSDALLVGVYARRYLVRDAQQFAHGYPAIFGKDAALLSWNEKITSLADVANIIRVNIQRIRDKKSKRTRLHKRYESRQVLTA